ncbi:MAG: maleylacetate reductase [Rhodospirillaceae bacterium]|nr:maleylacetate reductase [Rhodospirillaceae bacterium]
MDSFIFKGLPTRVIFGRGKLAVLGHEVERLGLTRVAVLTTPQQRATGQEIAGQLGPVLCAGHLDTATMHTPLEVTEDALAWCREHRVDGLVPVGGGSTVGLSKALSLRTWLPQICVPTTYAGSEMTDILGQTIDGKKQTQRGPEIQPQVAIYDPDLTDTMPIPLSITSGFNAIAHAIEALYAVDANPIIEYIATEGIRKLVGAMSELEGPNSRAARDEALQGAWFCGVSLGSCAMALHHKLAHVLGGSFNLPHAESHTALLPFSIAYNEPALNGQLDTARHALRTDNLAQAIFDLAKTLGAPTSLAEVGMPADGIDAATEIAISQPYSNPRPLSREGIRALLDDAYHGRRPS